MESSLFCSLVRKEHTFIISQFAGSGVLEQLNWFSAFGFHKVANYWLGLQSHLKLHWGRIDFQDCKIVGSIYSIVNY